MDPQPMHDAVAPLRFLLGTWRSTSARGAPFAYREQLEFATRGQSMLDYSSTTWHAADKHAMHLETGFLRIQPGGTRVSLLLAHNFGMTTVEEGEVDEARSAIRLKSTSVGRPSSAKEPKVLAVERSITLLDDGRLQVALRMATSDHPEMAQHLAATYEKVERV